MGLLFSVLTLNAGSRSSVMVSMSVMAQLVLSPHHVLVLVSSHPANHPVKYRLVNDFLLRINYGL